MSDCLGMCLQIIDNGVSIGTNAWGVCVNSISGDVVEVEWSDSLQLSGFWAYWLQFVALVRVVYHIFF